MQNSGASNWETEMGRKHKKKVRQLSAEQAAFGGVPDGIPNNEIDPKELMLSFIEAETGNLLKKKGLSDDVDARHPKSRSSQSGKGRYSLQIDLHGLTLAEALDQVDVQIRYCFEQGYSSIEALIITGKGLHSGSEGGILAREVHRHISGKYRSMILQIEESPASTLLNGVPIRGHFRVILKNER
jgi:DNA-nicking Smr family endonuclease